MLACAEPGGADRPDRRGDLTDPRRQRRRDAAALLARSRSRRRSACSPACIPGRIDLGIGRAPGTDPMTTFALQRDRRQAAPDDFPQQLAELLAYFDGRLPRRPPVRPPRRVLPGAPRAPEPWLLGSSPQSAIWAAELGLPYAFADFINAARRADRAALPRALPAVDAAGGARGRRRRVGDLRRDRRGGAAARVQRGDVVHAAAPGPADPGAAGRDGDRFLDARGRRSTRPPAAARSSARPRPSAPGSRRSPPRTAPRRRSWSRSRTTTPPAGAPTS